MSGWRTLSIVFAAEDMPPDSTAHIASTDEIVALVDAMRPLLGTSGTIHVSGVNLSVERPRP